MHTAGVVVVKTTGSNDDDVALTVTGDCSTDLLASVPNVIACARLRHGEALGHGRRGAKMALPAWSAETVHVPAVKA